MLARVLAGLLTACARSKDRIGSERDPGRRPMLLSSYSRGTSDLAKVNSVKNKLDRCASLAGRVPFPGRQAERRRLGAGYTKAQGVHS